MGSFTSMSKIIPSSNLNDDDVSYATTREDLETFLKRCSKHLSGKPEPIERRWKQAASSAKEEEKEVVPGENIRVMQWNCLSQGKPLSLPLFSRISNYTTSSEHISTHTHRANAY